MRQFKCKQFFSLKNTTEKPTKGSPAMERGISDQPVDTKKTTKMKRTRAFVRGFFRAAIGCFTSGCKANGHHQIDVCDIYRRHSSQGRSDPVSEREYESYTETPPACDVHTETPPACDVNTETPPVCDVHMETLPACDVNMETAPACDVHKENSSAWNFHLQTPPECDVHTEIPPVHEVHIETSPACDVNTETLPACDIHRETPSEWDVHVKTPPECDIHTETPTPDCHLYVETPAQCDSHFENPPKYQGSHENISSHEDEGKLTVKDRQILVVGDSVLRGTERAICQNDKDRRTVYCFPVARVRDIADQMDRLLDGAGEDPAVVLHIGTNDNIARKWTALQNDFRNLGAILKKRTSKVVFLEILPIPRATQKKQQDLRNLSKWLKNWCRKEEFIFMETWNDFSVGYLLYSKDGSRLSEQGAALLGKKITKKLKKMINQPCGLQVETLPACNDSVETKAECNFPTKTPADCGVTTETLTESAILAETSPANDLHTDTPPACDVHMETSPACDVHKEDSTAWEFHLQSPPECDAHTEISPVCEVHIETAPACDVHKENSSTWEFDLQTPPECDVRTDIPPVCEVHIESSPACDVNMKAPPACDIHTETSPKCQGNVSSENGGKVTRKDRPILVVGDGVIGRIQRAICYKAHHSRTVCCLPGARVRDIADCMDRLLDGAGEDPAVMVHIGTNDKVRGRWSALKNDFRDLGAILKKRSPKAIFSEILPVPRATPERQQELRELNKWLKNWCREEGFGFMANWDVFSVNCNLYSSDGMHLNGRGEAFLGVKMAKTLEEISK